MKKNIIRVVKDKRYFTASNIPFNDKNLSWEARGVMGYLLSKPDSWTVRNVDLYRQGPAGKNKVKRILTELKDAGYLVRKCFRKPDGKFEWESTVYETPTMAPKTDDGSADDGKQGHIVSTESIKGDGCSKETAESSSEHYNNSSELLTSISTNSSSDEPIPKDPFADLDDWKQHPAIQAVKKVSGYYPKKQLAARVANLVGLEPDINLMQDCHDLWVAGGHNPMNLNGWLFDWYATKMHYTNPNDQAVLEYSPEYDFQEVPE